MAMIMVDAQARADCGFNTDKDRWSEEQKLHVRACQKAPNRVPEAQFEARQKQLSRCFERSGREEEACIAFADDAVAQYDKAVAAACEFGESRQWNSSKSRHYVWCLDASKQQREEMSYQRERDLSECRRQASLRRACGDYADKAVEQALLNDNERCGLKGDGWSKYKDDHVAFCMREGERQARREADGRQDELERCIAQNSRRNDECEQYADRAVRLAKINDERNCGNRDRRLWSTNSREHYDFCMRAKPGVRQEVQQQRRKAIQSCSIFRGFRLQITF
jgi:hypothetical protein